MIRFSKILFTNPAQIWLSGINCNYDNIIKIINIFNCKWFLVTIDSIADGSSLLSLLEDHGLKYVVKQCPINYIEVSAIIPSVFFDVFLKNAINEDPENIFVFNLLDPTNYNIYLQRSFEHLVATGITNVFISFSLDHRSLLICMNKFLLSPRDVFNKIKALCF